MFKLFSKEKSAQAGSSAVEFALILPFMLYFMFFTIELCLLFFSQLVVEQGMIFAARDVKTRAAIAADNGALATIIRDRSFGIIHPEEINVVATNVTTPGGALNEPGAVVTYQVTYNWKVLVPGLGRLLHRPSLNFGTDGIFVVSSGIAVRNE